MKKYQIDNKKHFLTVLFLCSIALFGCAGKETEEVQENGQPVLVEEKERVWSEDQSYDGQGIFLANTKVPVRDGSMEETGEVLEAQEKVAFVKIEKDEKERVRGMLGEDRYVLIENGNFEYAGPETEKEESLAEEVPGVFSKDGIIVVNKKHGVPADYAPGEDPEAKAALIRLIAAMQAQGLDISNDYSGYRSYAYQNELYNGYCASYGEETANTFSARPGYSEHQTGLAYDLKHSSGELVTQEREAQWLLDHAADHGFIVRYQEGKESITGYQAEPWHIRYIGDEAKEIMDSGLTLEEYLNVEGGEYD